MIDLTNRTVRLVSLATGKHYTGTIKGRCLDYPVVYVDGPETWLLGGLPFARATLERAIAEDRELKI